MTNRTEQNTVWKWAAVGYVITLHLLLAALVVKTDLIPKLKAKLGVIAANPDPHVSNMLRIHQWMDESVPDKAIIFLGDSITQGLATAAVAPLSVNYGIGSENTAQLLNAIPSYKSLARADVIFVTIGINDLDQGMKSELNERYRKMLELLPRKTPLIWSAVMPAKSGNITFSDIDDANQTVRTLCANRGNCIFVDTWGIFADRNGQMIARMFLDDGVHLSAEGYSAWIAALKEAIKSIPLVNSQAATS